MRFYALLLGLFVVLGLFVTFIGHAGLTRTPVAPFNNLFIIIHFKLLAHA